MSYIKFRLLASCYSQNDYHDLSQILHIGVRMKPANGVFKLKNYSGVTVFSISLWKQFLIWYLLIEIMVAHKNYETMYLKLWSMLLLRMIQELPRISSGDGQVRVFYMYKTGRGNFHYKDAVLPVWKWLS